MAATVFLSFAAANCVSGVRPPAVTARLRSYPGMPPGGSIPAVIRQLAAFKLWLLLLAYSIWTRSGPWFPTREVAVYLCASRMPTVLLKTVFYLTSRPALLSRRNFIQPYSSQVISAQNFSILAPKELITNSVVDWMSQIFCFHIIKSIIFTAAVR